MDGATVNIGTEKAHQEHQPDHAGHAAMIHVVRQKRGIDVGYLGRRDFCVFKIPVAFRIGGAESIQDSLGEFPQIPTVSELGILPILVKGDDAAQPVGAKSFCDVRKIVNRERRPDQPRICSWKSGPPRRPMRNTRPMVPSRRRGAAPRVSQRMTIGADQQQEYFGASAIQQLISPSQQHEGEGAELFACRCLRIHTRRSEQ